MKRIAWIAFTDIVRQPDGTLYSEAASARYRIIMPLERLSKEHWHSDVIALAPGKAPDAAALRVLEKADIVVFSKSFDPVNEALVRKAQAGGGKVIFDICDHHFDHPLIGAHYREMAKMADFIVCNTPAMAEIAAPYTTAPCRVIEDPVEGARCPARFAPGERLKLLWFGSPLNFDSLNAAMRAILSAAVRTKLHLTLVSQLSPELISYCAGAEQATQGALTMTTVPWSLPAQQRALEEADAVIIPTLAEDKKRVKSANRMIESLQAGRAVVAGPLPAYERFSQWAYVGAGMEQGIAWLQREAARIPALIEQAQGFIDEHYAPAVIARQWEAALKELA